ncbi:MAG: hypothetical protein L0H55_15800, partial [Candidatus Nitrosocosmicus sp.]|nr:hypothetical protein [Candidatus Nitrosocosmicus sp.]
DLLFELSVKKIGLDIDYYGKNKVILLKLHGSCNFLLPKGISIIDVKIGINNFINTTEFEIGTAEEVREYCKSNNSIPPIMSIYMRNKPFIGTSDRIKQINQEWIRQISKADKILIIGVKPNPDDKHIWDYISAANAEVGYIGDKDQFEIWKNQFRKNKNNRYLGKYWNDSFNKSISFLS